MVDEPILIVKRGHIIIGDPGEPQQAGQIPERSRSVTSGTFNWLEQFQIAD
jgi:hypothetical protein